ALAGVRDPVRDERRGDPLSPPTWRHAPTFQPALGRCYRRELSHTDDAAGRFGYEERPRPVRDPRIEDVGYSVVTAPEGPHRGEHVASVRRTRATDHQIHRAILPQLELAGLRRC